MPIQTKLNAVFAGLAAELLDGPKRFALTDFIRPYTQTAGIGPWLINREIVKNTGTRRFPVYELTDFGRAVVTAQVDWTGPAYSELTKEMLQKAIASEAPDVVAMLKKASQSAVGVNKKALKRTKPANGKPAKGKRVNNYTSTSIGRNIIPILNELREDVKKKYKYFVTHQYLLDTMVQYVAANKEELLDKIFDVDPEVKLYLEMQAKLRAKGLIK